MKLLRRAFEAHIEEKDDKKTISISGPLSEVYTKALQVAYCKTDPILNEPMVADLKDPKPAMETAAQDAQLLGKFIETITGASVNQSGGQTASIYAVSRQGLDETEYVKVAEAATKAEDNFILVVDATQPSPVTPVSSAPVEKVVNLETALENLVSALGGRFFTVDEAYSAYEEHKGKLGMEQHVDKEVARQLTQPGEIPAHLSFPTSGASVRVFRTMRNEIDLPSYVEITNELATSTDESPVVVTVDVSANGEMKTDVATVAVESLVQIAKKLKKPLYVGFEAYQATLK